jgi:D-beta-D-heptose 7-phosphate kinase/D-beta-D-heptose 1-phosphate adenosyltransferase
MNPPSAKRVQQLLTAIRQSRVLVVGDVMLDQFLWGRVSRISPEAPVPVVEFESESFMPGGAANVARNLASLGGQTELFGAVGRDPQAAQLKQLLGEQNIGVAGLVPLPGYFTATKTRIVAHRQQVVRVDRETRGPLNERATAALLRQLEIHLPDADAVIVADYGKGVVTQPLLATLRSRCRDLALWLSLDAKPAPHVDLAHLSLIKPNRREAFALAGLEDTERQRNPLEDGPLRRVAEKLLTELRPALLLITLGEQGLLLCQRGQPLFHIPTMAQEVFDVSGAGDTVIASFTLAIAAGASPVEAAYFSNHAAGIVVGKVGTATVSPAELSASFGGKQ